MANHISLTILETNTKAKAVLYEQDAPITCQAMWEILKYPIEKRVRQSIWCGRKVTIDVPEKNRLVNPVSIPRENSTVFPSTGELLWNYWPPHAVRGFPEGVWDMMFIYGPDTIMKGPLGQEPCNLWAYLVEGGSDFIEECNKFRMSGTKTFRIERD
jgi:hypothetical protein